MNVLVLLLIVGASLAIGIASLDNNIVTSAQDIGVGEITLDSPVDSSLILLVERTNPDSQTDYKDLIVTCTFVLPDGEPTIVTGSTIYCKLLDEDGNLIAEGQITLSSDLVAPDEVDIPITWFAFPNSNNIENVFDIVFVVQGPQP